MCWQGARLDWGYRPGHKGRGGQAPRACGVGRIIEYSLDVGCAHHTLRKGYVMFVAIQYFDGNVDGESKTERVEVREVTADDNGSTLFELADSAPIVAAADADWDPDLTNPGEALRSLEATYAPVGGPLAYLFAENREVDGKAQLAIEVAEV